MSQYNQAPLDNSSLPIELSELFQEKNWFDLDTAVKNYAKQNDCKINKSSDSIGYSLKCKNNNLSRINLAKEVIISDLKPLIQKTLDIMKSKGACSWSKPVKDYSSGKTFYKDINCSSEIDKYSGDFRKKNLFGDISIDYSGMGYKGADGMISLNLKYKKGLVEILDTYSVIGLSPNDSVYLDTTSPSAKKVNIKGESFSDVSLGPYLFNQDSKLGIMDQIKCGNGVYKKLLENAINYYENNKDSVSTPYSFSVPLIKK